MSASAVAPDAGLVFPSGDKASGDKSRADKSSGDRASGDDTVGEYDTAASPDWEGDALTQWKEGAVIADRFRISGFIGQGGMGKVYVAEDEILQRSIALKRIPQEILFDIDARDDLRQEANRLLDLAHVNIVRVHTYYDGPTWPFFAMEYLRGPTLKKLLHERKRAGEEFSSEEVLVLARQIAAGLTHAHENGVIHRDLKPANLMLAEPLDGKLTEDCTVKITDFGISRVIADSTLRQTAKRSGTLPYMSPEQYRGEATTVRSDIYSLSCTFYELLAGKPPFHSGDIGYQILNVPAKSFPSNKLPRAMTDTIMRGLSKDPRDRFESVNQFVQALEGKVRVPRRGFTRDLVSLGSMMAVGLAFILLVLSGMQAVFEGSSDGDAGRQNNLNPANRTATPEYSAEEVTKVSQVVTREFKRQIGDGLGIPSDGPAILRPIPTRRLILEFREGPSGLREEVLANLRLTYWRSDIKVPHGVKGAKAEGVWTFDIGELKQGNYEIMPSLQPTSRQGQMTKLKEAEYNFWVDLIAPEFDVQVSHSEQFVDLETLATYDDEVELAIVPGPGSRHDFSAFFRRELGGSIEKISDTTRWTIRLEEPGMHTCYVYGVDAAGNISEPRELKLHRYELGLRSVEVVGFSGSLAEISGTLVYEGERPPALAFWIDGEEVEPQPTTGPEGIQSGENATAPVPGVQSFVYILALPKVKNNIEFRYRWGDRASRSLDTFLEDVTLPAPHFEIASYPENTQQSEVVIEGVVSPAFEGIDLRIELLGRSEMLVDLVMGDGEARFSETVRLFRNQLNTITLTPYYRESALLEPSAPRITIRHDEEIPVVLNVELLENGYSEMRLKIETSEPLASLSGRVVTGKHDQPDFIDLPLQPTGEDRLRHFYVFRVPFGFTPGSFLELGIKDLAGNLNTARELIYGDPSEVGGPVRIDQRAPRESYVALVSRAAFLKVAGVRFVDFDCSDESLQMMGTELPASTWDRFLAHRRGSSSAGEDNSFLPMVLGSQDVSLIQEFAAWFQKMAEDGYEYFVPTEAQWLCAFCDTKYLFEARRDIESWFRKEFELRPGHRYGENQVSRIGSRKVNATPTGLLDMESNLQEIVLKREGGSAFAVIGGHFQIEDRQRMIQACLYSRVLDNDRRDLQGRMTGLRLCRRPATHSAKR